MRRLVLVRHGQSHWNREGRFQGQSGTGLTEIGQEQAKHVAAWLAEAHPGASVLVSSDLQRCVETTEPIANALGIEPAVDERLRERSFGELEGRRREDVMEEYPDFWENWIQGIDQVTELGGESGASLAARATAAFSRHVEAVEEDGVVVVVSHGGTIWHGTHALLGFELDTHHRNAFLGGLGNTAVCEVIFHEEYRWLDRWNQTGHLPAELQTTFRAAETRAEEK